jgi:hypothetical protein
MRKERKEGVTFPGCIGALAGLVVGVLVVVQLYHSGVVGKMLAEVWRKMELGSLGLVWLHFVIAVTFPALAAILPFVIPMLIIFGLMRLGYAVGRGIGRGVPGK